MIGVAVVGAGHWGPNLIRNFHDHQSSDVLWVVDLDQNRLERAAGKFPGVRTSGDYRSALDDPQVDAVVVATPTSTHYQFVRDSLHAGKHVLVEKPITDDLAQGEELVALAERQGLVLMVGHVFVYNAGVQRVKQFLESGQLGRVYYVGMTRTNLGPIRTDVNAAWDLASHDISIANYLLGGEPASVSALGHDWINPGIEDAVFATFRYPNEVLVHLHVSWLNPRKARDITVVCERQMLTLDDMDLSEPIRIYDKGVRDDRTSPGWADTFASFRASIREGDITVPRVALGEPLKNECEHFLECIQTKGRPLTDGAAGLAVVRALAALQRSLDGGGREEQVGSGQRSIRLPVPQAVELP